MNYYNTKLLEWIIIDIHPDIIQQNRPEFRKQPRISEMTDQCLDKTPMFRRSFYQFLKGNTLARWITTVMLTELLLPLGRINGRDNQGRVKYIQRRNSLLPSSVPSTTDIAYRMYYMICA